MSEADSPLQKKSLSARRTKKPHLESVSYKQKIGELRVPRPPAWLLDLLQQEQCSFSGVSGPEGWLQEGVKAMQRSTAGVIYAGWCFRRAKDEAGGGRAWVDARAAEIGFSKAVIYDCMSLSARAETWPPEAIPRLLQIEPSKLIRALRGWEPAQMEQLARGEEVYGVTLDLVRELGVRELVERIKAHAPETQRLQAELAHERVLRQNAEMRLELQSRLAEGAPRPDWPEPVLMVREEAVALAEKACLAIDDLRLQAEYCMTDHGFVGCGHAAVSAAVACLYLNVRAVAAKASQLAHQIAEFYPEEVDESHLPVLTQFELQHAIERRQWLVDEHRLEKQLRADRRAAQQPRRRGRPRKTGRGA